MKECDFEDALTEAEKACARCVGELFDDVKTYRSTNPGNPDCNVFDVGYMATGECALFDSASYHWRAQLDLYRRDRTTLQRALMRILGALPISAGNRAEAELRETSNVLTFRVAPEAKCVGEITTVNVNPDKDANPIAAYVATVAFDVTFAARF